jgi:hypothetical protein
MTEGGWVVGIDFVCGRHPDETLARCRRGGAEDPQMWVTSFADGSLPEDRDRPGKLLMLCPRCPNDYQRKGSDVQEALDALFAANHRGVVRHLV